MGDGAKKRQAEWTHSIAVGSRSFIEDVNKARLGFRGKGRDIIEADKGYQLRESAVYYNALFQAEKDDIGTENTFFWDIKISRTYLGPTPGHRSTTH